MAECIAVKGCEFEVPEAIEPSPGVPGFQASIISPAEQYVLVCDKAPYAGQMQIALQNVKTAAITNGDGKTTAPAIISGAAHFLINNKSAIVEGDEVQDVVVSGHSGESSVTDTVTIKIKKAGQEYVKVT